MPSNTTYNPPNIESFVKSALNFDAKGIIVSAIAGTTTNLDLALTDDMLLTGAQVLTNSACFGDSISFQVVDVDGIFYPANTVLSQFITNWKLRSDSQEQIDIQVNYPAKIVTGLYLRIVYNSTGSSNVNVAVNYTLHKVLI